MSILVNKISKLYMLAFVALVPVMATTIARAQDEAADKAEDNEEVIATEYSQLDTKQRQVLTKGANLLLDSMMLRVRVPETKNGAMRFGIGWSEGGEGLSGKTRKGTLLPVDYSEKDKGSREAHLLDLNEWSAPVSLRSVAGGVYFWKYPTLNVSSIISKPGVRPKSTPDGGAITELEFSANGKVFKTFQENSPRGMRRSFVVPTHLLAQGLFRQGYLEKPTDNPTFDPKFHTEFIEQLQGVSDYARARYQRLQKKYSPDDVTPRLFGVVGNVTGYGVSGLGVRYGDPEIVRTEMKSLRLLGFNGHKISNSIYKTTGDVVVEENLTKQEELDRTYWGGPGAGTPMSFFRGKDDIIASPFHPDLKEHIKLQVDKAIAEHELIPAKEKWGLWGDEIFVAMDQGFEKCPLCVEEFRKFLKLNNVQPADVGASSWDQVMPAVIREKNEKGRTSISPRPDSKTDRLRYYYTVRFASYATGLLYADAAKAMEEKGIWLYTMHNPKPSWGGSLFDWHDFYAAGANRGLVFETSNRDPRIWQWDSYLSDIMRGVAEGTTWQQGAIIKPHRGASKQRMLSLVTRGTRAFEWYTYGPDYAKGDSYSQNPELLEVVAEANRFLGKAEEHLYEAKRPRQPEVAFVYPRASYVWEVLHNNKANKFEDAKWVYSALTQAHIPVDVLSAEMLNDRDLSRYKAIYIVGSNLQRDAASKVKAWVLNGGLLWTDAIGLSRDEADEPLTVLQDVLGLGERTVEAWGSAPSYGATSLKGMTEKEVPAFAAISLTPAGKSTLPVFAAAPQEPAGETPPLLRAYVAREVMQTRDAEVLATFADGKPAMTRKRFGKGEAVVAGLYAGLAYSAKVRRSDFDMSTDFNPALRELIVGPALQHGVYRPVVPASSQVESVLLERNGQRSVALMNWAYSGRTLQPVSNLKVALPGVGKVTKVRSLLHGDLPLQGSGATLSVVLPEMNEVDLLILE